MLFRMRWIFFIILFVCVGHFCRKQTDDFTLLAIRSHRPYDSSWETAPPSSEVRAALNQPYTYYGKGGQSFIFFSQDGKFVLKFFKQKVFTYPAYLEYFPIPFVIDKYKAKKRWKRQDKLLRDFSSYKASFEELQEETGVLFAHLNKTSYFQQSLTIVDKLGIAHSLSLDEVDFVLQKRAVLVYDKIQQLMESGKEEEAKQAISSVFSLIHKRCQKGFHDRDPNIRTNCGFLEDKAIKIDVGRFVKSPSMQSREVYSRELIRITAPFKEWISETHPSLLPFFDAELVRMQNAPSL